MERKWRLREIENIAQGHAACKAQPVITDSASWVSDKEDIYLPCPQLRKQLNWAPFSRGDSLSEVFKDLFKALCLVMVELGREPVTV